MQDQFWYPQLEGDDTDSKVVSVALNQFASLFDGGEYDPNSPLTSKPNDLFNLDSLLEKLEEGIEDDLILVVGTCSKEKAVEHSWEQLGLNLFDLPWSESGKAFHYVSATSLFEDVGALNLLLGKRDGDIDSEDVTLGKVKRQLEWAKCHRFASAVQNAVGHGERDEFQSMERHKIASELDGRLEGWDNQWGDHFDNCPACRRLREEVQSLVDGGGEGKEYAREVADLDSRTYRFSPATYFNSDEMMAEGPRFRSVIVLEDDEKFRSELIDEISQLLIPNGKELESWKYVLFGFEYDKDNPRTRIYRSRNKDKFDDYIFIKVASKEKSLSGYCLRNSNGDDIIYEFINRGVKRYAPWRASYWSIDDLAHPDEVNVDEIKIEGDMIESLNGQNVDFSFKFDSSEVLTCFDLDLGTSAEGLSDTLHSGLWVMYGTACSYPEVSRLVVTGYRSQGDFGHGAGAHGYLMKPFTQAGLKQEIQRVQEIRHVTWVCPRGIQKDYTILLSNLTGEESGTVSFKNIKSLLERHLQDNRISLKVVDNIEGAHETGALARSDLIVLDPFLVTIGRKELRKELSIPRDHRMIADTSDKGDLDRMIGDIRSVDPETPLLLMLPADSTADGEEWKPESVVANYLRGSPLRLQEGRDTIARKPFWVAADGHSDREAGLANQIQSLLSAQDEYDVKYQVIIAVGAVLGRFGECIHEIKDEMCKGDRNLDELFKPLLPALVRAYGLSASLNDLQAIKTARLANDLCQQVRRDQDQNGDDWFEVEKQTIDDIIYYFAIDAIYDASIQRHVTLENWMRRMVDRKARMVYQEEVNGPDGGKREERQSGFEDISPLIRPLTRLFGGSTRYEFNARGTWYDAKNKRVDDILIVVEFSARSLIVARNVVEDLAVHYLSEVAGEDEVMVQEISADAHFWSDS